jgi:hypothetical protein
MEVVCESGFGYHMGGVLGSSIAKEFGTWEYVTGMTGRSLAGKKGRSWARSCYERFEGFLCAGKLIS